MLTLCHSCQQILQCSVQTCRQCVAAAVLCAGIASALGTGISPQQQRSDILACADLSAMWRAARRWDFSPALAGMLPWQHHSRTQ